MELAAEIVDEYPEKQLTIIHSRPLLLSGDDLTEFTKKRLQSRLEARGIRVILNDRAILLPEQETQPYICGSHVIETEKGLEIESDLTIYCIGKAQPNSRFLQSTLPHLLDRHGFIKVKMTLQVDDADLGHIYSLGDVAATGAAKMTKSVMEQAPIVAQNIQTQIQDFKSGKKSELKLFKPPKDDMIAIPLGKGLGIVQVGFLPLWLQYLLAPLLDLVVGFVKRQSLYSMFWKKLLGW